MIATIDGRRIGYDDSGGPGVPLVLLHGFPLDRSIWDEQLPALSAVGARAIRVDLRGCGESEPSDGPALMEALAGDIAGLLDALHVERAALVGHSIGGYVALAFFRMYAERVAGLALVASHVAADALNSTNADPAQRELAATREELARRLETEGTMDAAVESYLPKYFAPHVYNENPQLVERARAIMQRQNPRGSAELVRGMKERLDSHDLLEDVHVPALVVSGGEDVYLKPETLRTTAYAIDGAAFVQLQRVGHLPMLEAPLEIADALASFTQRVRGFKTA
ncbi:MAG: alpha/beta fold hydrolase [Candidatus Eremiobacteraeota bacterium]|nr:alpha/beta fold hydrolase [Candidatus Eremiobacteraeota bacterium]